MAQRQIIKLAEVRRRFRQAYAALDNVSPIELQFWVTPDGRLHCDDAYHPAFDDVWNPETEQWEGSSDDYDDDEDL